jgi:hypothetical protein
MESGLEPPRAFGLWVIESLVKIVDQIESIQEIQIFRCFLGTWQQISGILLLEGNGFAAMALAREHARIAFDWSFNGPALDVDALMQSTFGDLALRVEIVGLFLDQVESVDKSLGLPQDAKGWHYLTHTLKGASTAVGACEIASLAEAWAGQGPPDDVSARGVCQGHLQAALARFVQATQALPR